MAAARVGVLRESTAGERRVALTPDVVRRIRNAGVDVFIETGAGDAAWYPDDEYAQAGASIVDAASVRETADVLLCVQPPPREQIRDGQTVIGLLGPLLRPELMRDLAVRKRKTEVDAQVAIIAEIAATHGLPTPLVDCIVRLINEVEDGKRPMDRGNLDILTAAMR
jgi:NAD/NADP transhydrogenase alpha subunit